MRKTAFFLTLLLLVTASCSKNERNEKKFLKGILSESFEESAAANQEFNLWLSSDEGTMTYDFPLMREQIGLKVATSPDSVVRCYSWCLDRNSENPKYDNVIQWIAQGRMVAFSGTLDYLLAGRKNDLKKMSSFGHSIDTIFEITSGNRPVYMIGQSFIYDGQKRKAYAARPSVTCSSGTRRANASMPIRPMTVPGSSLVNTPSLSWAASVLNACLTSDPLT